MTPSLTPDGFVSTKEAAKTAGYSADYLARLARSGEVKGVQIGRAWFVDPVSLAEYLKAQEIKKRERLEELSRSRIEEYKASKEPAAVPVRISSVVRTPEPPKAPLRPTPRPRVPVLRASVHVAASLPTGLILSPLSATLRPSTRASRVGAVVAACAIVIAGVFVGDTRLLPDQGTRTIALLESASTGFTYLVEPVRESIGLQLAALDAYRAHTSDLATDTGSPSNIWARPPPFDLKKQIREQADLTSNQAVESHSLNREIPPLRHRSANPIALIGSGIAGFVDLVHTLINGEAELAYAVPQTIAPGTSRIALETVFTIGEAGRLAGEMGSDGIRTGAVAITASPRALIASAAAANFSIPRFPQLPAVPVGYVAGAFRAITEAYSDTFAATSKGIFVAVSHSGAALETAKKAFNNIVSSAHRGTGSAVHLALEKPQPEQTPIPETQDAPATEQTAAAANAAPVSGAAVRPSPGPQTLPVIVSVPVSGKDLSYGDLISYDPGTGLYMPASAANSSVVGIAVENPPVLLSTEQADPGVPIVRSGRALVNVTLQNGDIAPGDSIAPSSIPGKAMKASQGATGAIGIAREAFSGGTASSTTLINNGTSVSVGTIVVDVNATGGESPGVGQCPQGSVLCAIASKVNATPLVQLLRYLVAAAIALGSLFLAFRTFMADAVSGVISVGRNPRAKTAIQAMVIFNGVLAVGIAIAGLVAGLIILFIKI